MVAYPNGGMRMWHVESVAFAREYACSKNGKQREAAARSGLTPVAYSGRLIYDRMSYVRRAAAENPKTPVGGLIAHAHGILAGKTGGALPDVAAGNPALPSWLAGDAVTRAVQEAEREGRKSVPLSVYRLLATVEDRGVRCDAANRVGVPPDVLAALAYDEDSQVRETAFRNSAMPERVYDDVIVRDVGMSAAVCDALKGSKSVTAHMLSVMRLAPPYVNKGERHACESMYTRSKKLLEERGIEVE